MTISFKFSSMSKKKILATSRPISTMFNCSHQCLRVYLHILCRLRCNWLINSLNWVHLELNGIWAFKSSWFSSLTKLVYCFRNWEPGFLENQFISLNIVSQVYLKVFKPGLQKLGLHFTSSTVFFNQLQPRPCMGHVRFHILFLWRIWDRSHTRTCIICASFQMKSLSIIASITW